MADLKLVVPIGGGNPNPTPPPITSELTDLVIGNDTFKINKDGNAVDDKGTVLKTKDELEKLKPTSQIAQTDAEKETAKRLVEQTIAAEAQLIDGAEIELDEVKYKINKDGAAVDATGKVIKTKAELTTLILTASENEEVNYINEIQKATNLTPVSDTGQPVTYENTVPGLTQYAQDVYKEGRKLGATEYEQELFSKFPILQQVVEHLTINGSLENFTQNIDYSKIVIGDDENQQIDLFTKAKLAQGLSQSEITDMVNYYKADKKLKGAAETGLAFLKTSQEANDVARATAVAESKRNAEIERTAYWNEVHKTLSTKQLVVGDKKFTIPEVIKVKTDDGKFVTKTIKDFQDYIEKPLNFKVGEQVYTMTQLEYDEAMEDTKRTPHHDIFDAFRKFTKYDDSQIINANVNNNIVKNVIKLNTKASSGGSGTATGGKKLILSVK
jgi:hypothetical protein